MMKNLEKDLWVMFAKARKKLGTKEGKMVYAQDVVEKERRKDLLSVRFAEEKDENLILGKVM